MSHKRDAYRVLSKGRAGRAVVAVTRAVELALRREPTLVHFDAASQGWVHRNRHGSLVLPEPRGHALRGFETQCRDAFLRDYTPGPGDAVLDVGAGFGSEALTFARLVGPTGQVISIEAHPRTYEMLERTISLNRLSQVNTLHAAVMESAGTVHISDLGDEASHINKVGDSGVEVSAVALDELVDPTMSIAFLKMNIEGAETPALRGASKTLSRTQHVAIACHDFLAEETNDPSYRTKRDVRALLVASGFVVTGREDDPRPWARDYLFGSRVEA
jgi:FkbM family methyltransferase